MIYKSFLLLIILLFSFASNIFSKEKIVFGIDKNYPPHEYVENGKVKGFNVDIIKAVAREINCKIIWKPMVWSDAYLALKEGRIDVLCMASYKERAKYFDFTDEIILDLSLAIFVKSDTVGIEDVKELAYHTVAVERNDIAHSMLSKLSPDAIIIPVESQVDAIKLLENGDVFAYFGNKCTGLYLIHKYKYYDIKIIGEKIPIAPRVFGVKKGNLFLKNILDVGLKKIKETGEYQKIYNKWFGISPFRFVKVLRYLIFISIFSIALIAGILYWNKLLQKKIETKTKELKKAEERYRKLVENSPLGIILLDKENNILLLNTIAENLLNERREDIIKKSIFDLKIFNSRKRELKNILSKIHMEEINEPWKIKFQKEFKTVVLQIYGYTYTEINNEVVTLLILRDITEEERLHEHIFQMQKMEAIGRLVGGIAHDFNNILTGIVSLTELMQSQKEIPRKLKDDLQTLDRLANKATDLTSKLLIFSKQQMINPRIVNLNHLIKNLQGILARILGENIEIELYLDENLDNIKIDPVQFEQIIFNLASNSKEAMPEGGKIIIETKNVELDKRYTRTHPDVKPGRYCILSFSDTGYGMDERIKSRIFEPFFTTKKDGTGLGLSTVYGIVTKNNGFIFVYSELKKGTTFKIYFPAFKTKAQKKRKEEKFIKLLDKNIRGKTILVVEDDMDVRNLITRFLRDMDLNVYSVKNGDAALNLIRTIPENIELLITDVILPDTTGKALSDKIKEIFPKIKILFVSGYTENVIAKNGIITEEINFLQKPFTLKEFYKRIVELL